MKIVLIIIRAFGFIVSFIFLFLVVANIINSIVYPEDLGNNVWNDYTFYALVFLASFAYFLAWKHEGLGGLILTICGLIISYISDWKLGIPFFTIGQLFVLFWVLKNRRSRKRVIKT